MASVNMAVYYNENDPKTAAWLRELIKARLVADGEVDDRSIVDVRAEDLRGFRQCHFFAGIGGWSYALRLAGWPDERPVWTGSCPCQPFSAAGKQKGEADERHLWPELRRLISKCCPATIFGEQVASGAGRQWLTGVRADLETLGYAVGAADLCAAGVAAPCIRQRLFWVGCAEQPGLERHAGHGNDGCQSGRIAAQTNRPARPAGSTGYWDTFDTVECEQDKIRRIEPGSFPLAHGIPARVGRLRGYGNTIVPQVAAEFITAYMEACT